MTIFTATPRAASSREHLARVDLGRVEKGGEAAQREGGLVADHGVRMVSPHLPVRDAEHPEPVVRERIVQRDDPLPCRRVERRTAGRAGFLVVGREAHDVLGRALDHEQPRTGILDQHRDAPALEIEGHLVDLGPAGRVDVGVREDRLVERTA